ncbi:hypothetical protein [Candidatus Galacturonibacter soehngenii]|uniref:DUF3784 domain-containing protein n=1 Tax=Candidatus Galacturonatibacter soehngenii TaxID=2307010 RepID=A0A7V7QMM5_9FIRM|nr:hypothetical protein [Candidatus Galacturonibacter soehngenii]KAB1439518.1 hypothetical protein F7O84_03760 [Candidatus Galacturonibacter soehngenii]MBA4687034.1 hypothetical protein [Candidatus Galacturonibacter soehngenii]
MEFGGLIDGIIFACGVYMLYSAYLMKTKGELKVGWLVSKNVNLERSKDVPGYISYMYPRVLFFAISTLIYSFVGFYNAYITSLGIVQTVTFFGFFAVVVWFAIISTRASKKYLSM